MILILALFDGIVLGLQLVKSCHSPGLNTHGSSRKWCNFSLFWTSQTGTADSPLTAKLADV